MNVEAPDTKAGENPADDFVSVVIPTRNRWELLSRALASVLAQEDVALEVIVVDEGSTDETPAKLASIDDERVRSLRNDVPTGVARARNRGVEAARGEWVAFLDDDDFWAPAKLRVQLDACAATGAAFSYTGLVTTDPSLERRRVSLPFPSAGLERTILDMNLVGPPSSVIARRSLVSDAGGFDPEFSILADWDMWIRLATAAPAVACDEPLTGYLSHPDNMHLDAEAAIAELRRLRVKHAAPADALGVRIGGERWLAWIAIAAWFGAPIPRRGPLLLGRSALATPRAPRASRRSARRRPGRRRGAAAVARAGSHRERRGPLGRRFRDGGRSAPVGSDQAQEGTAARRNGRRGRRRARTGPVHGRREDRRRRSRDRPSRLGRAALPLGRGQVGRGRQRRAGDARGARRGTPQPSRHRHPLRAREPPRLCVPGQRARRGPEPARAGGLGRAAAIAISPSSAPSSASLSSTLTRAASSTAT